MAGGGRPGPDCTLQPNKLVSPPHDSIAQRGADRPAGLRLLLPPGQPRGRHGGADPPHAAPGRARVPVRRTRRPRRRPRVRADRRPDQTLPPGRSTSRWRSRSSTGSRRCSARTRTCRSTTSTTSCMVVLAAARPERQRLPHQQPPARGDDRDRRPGLGRAPARRSPSTRSTRTRCARSPSSASCSTRARPFPAAASRSTRPAALRDRRGAGGRPVARRAESTSGAGRRRRPRSPGSTAIRSRATRSRAEDRPVLRRRDEPNNPIRPLDGRPTRPLRRAAAGHEPHDATAQALFTLTQKIGLPEPMVRRSPTPTWRPASWSSDGFTVLINPAATIPAGAGATALQAFVNHGGRYIGTLAGGTTSRAQRRASRLLNTYHDQRDRSTPGSFFTADLRHVEPGRLGLRRRRLRLPRVDWRPGLRPGDAGRQRRRDPGGHAPVATTPTRCGVLRLSRNATGAGQLAGRPAVVDQPFGAGPRDHARLRPVLPRLAEQDERLVLNAVLYPGERDRRRRRRPRRAAAPIALTPRRAALPPCASARLGRRTTAPRAT